MNVWERRDSYEIAAEILRKAKRGCKKTHIMHGANLGQKQLKKYLEWLCGCGVLDNGCEGNYFKTTQKGLQVLKVYSKIEAILNDGIEVKKLGSNSPYVDRRFL